MDYNQALDYLSGVDFVGEDAKTAQDMQDALASGAGDNPEFQQMVIEFANAMQAKQGSDEGTELLTETGEVATPQQTKLAQEQFLAQSGDPEELAQAWASFKGLPLDEARKYSSSMPNRVRAEIMGEGKVDAIEGGVALTGDLLSGLGRGVVATTDALTGNEDFLTSFGRTKAAPNTPIVSQVAEGIARDPLSVLGFGTAKLGSMGARSLGKLFAGSAEPLTRLGRGASAALGGGLGGGMDLAFESVRRDATGEIPLSAGESLAFVGLPTILSGAAGARASNALSPNQASLTPFGGRDLVQPQGGISPAMPENLQAGNLMEQEQLLQQMEQASTPSGFLREQIDLLPETTRLLPTLAKNDPQALQRVNEYAGEILESQTNPNVTFGRRINAHLADAMNMLDTQRKQTGANMAGIEQMAQAQGVTIFPKSKMVEELNKSLQASPYNLSLVDEDGVFNVRSSGVGNLETPTEINRLARFIADLPDGVTGEQMRQIERQINGLISDRAVSRASQGVTTDEKVIIDFKNKVREAVFESIESQLDGPALAQYKELRKQYGKLAETKDELERRIGREVDNDFFARGVGFLAGSLKNESDRGARGLLNQIKDATGKDLQKEIAYFESAKKMVGEQKGTTLRDMLSNPRDIFGKATDFLSGRPDPRKSIPSAVLQAQGGSYDRAPLDFFNTHFLLTSKASAPLISNPEFQREQK